MKFKIIIILLLFSTSLAVGQLDTIHWMPPMHARIDWGPQYLYLSTPEKDSFKVIIRDGSNNVVSNIYLSNSKPYTFSLGGDNNNLTLVPDTLLSRALKNRGLVIVGEKKFYAYYRCHAANNNHAGDLTCKGRAALGKVFRIGHLLQESEPTNSRRANFIGIMATEDTTIITLSGYDPSTKLRKDGANVQANNGETVTLQKGECAVFSSYVEASSSLTPPNGLMGALLESNKPIAVNCGSWTGAPVTASAHDIGIDQIVPFENVGDEYILCKGNGSSALERPIIVAHKKNTKIYLNGSSSPIATLNEGEWIPLQTSVYSANDNLYIRSSEPIYVYQNIGGAPSGQNEFRTEGLIFVPPISCAIPNFIDNIISPNTIGNMSFNGGVMITAMKDSIVTVRIDGTIADLGPASPVQGNPDFVTYRNLTMFEQTNHVGNISIVAQGAVQVAMYGQNNAASFAAFYSGFSKTIKPSVELTHIGDGVCPDTLIAKGLFDGVQWVYEDSIIKFGKDTFIIISAPGRYIAQGYLGVCRRSETAADTTDISFVSPQFSYKTKQPTCYGAADGQIIFEKPYGGFPPYQYSVDNAATFVKNNVFDNVRAGVHKLVVRDSVGCYNRPLQISIGQPTEFKVEIQPIGNIPDVIEYGQEINLQGVTNHKYVSMTWSPNDGSNCKSCATYKISPIEKTRVYVLAIDTAGCRAVDTFLLYVKPNVYAPNVIAPLSNGGNQSFTLFSKENLPIHHLAIYDRWGEHIFETRNISTNVLEQGWDGTFKGQRVEGGVYIFYAEVEVLPGRTVIIKGDITVLY